MLSGSAAAPALRRRRPAYALLGTSLLIAALLLLPLAFLVLQAVQVGRHELVSLVFRGVSERLLWNTVRLAAVVTFACGTIGLGAAWCTERANLPWRRFWTVALVLPLAVPDFVIGYGWISVFPSVHGYWGSVLVMTVGSYPLVYLPVAAAFRASDPGFGDVARTLGIGRWRTFWRIEFPQLRPALLGGCLVVGLILLAEFGTFEVMSFQTFSTEIYTEFEIGFDTPAACALSLILVGLGLILLLGEAGIRSRPGSARRSQLSRPPSRIDLGPARYLMLFPLAGLLVLAIGIPLWALVYWLTQGTSSTLPPVSIVSEAATTAGYCASAAAVATAAALPVALLVDRHPSRASVLLERSTYIVLALPGLVVGLALVYFTVRYLPWVYQSSIELVFAYAVLFFPLALVVVRSAIAQAPSGLEDVARTLGARPISRLLRVTLPLLAPGLLAGFALVFLTACTELTATLLLHPTGVETLATQFWEYESNAAYGAAAPYALVLMLVAMIPGGLLGYWFERLGRRGM
jgi:iron(III) transport system permease protein